MRGCLPCSRKSAFDVNYAARRRRRNNPVTIAPNKPKVSCPEVKAPGCMAQLALALGTRLNAPDLIAHAYWATIHGLLVLRMAGKLDHGRSFDELRHAAMRLITRGARG